MTDVLIKRGNSDTHTHTHKHTQTHTEERDTGRMCVKVEDWSDESTSLRTPKIDGKPSESGRADWSTSFSHSLQKEPTPQTP